VCYADGQPLAVSNSPVRAVSHLLAAYWSFDIAMPSDAKAPLLLLSAACLGSKAPKEVSKYPAVVNLMNTLRLLK